jgi:hypothetical protein
VSPLRLSRTRCSAAPCGLALTLLLLAAAAAAQEPEIAATAPEDAAVHEITPADWTEPFCQGATDDWTYTVPRGHWIRIPLPWVAVDEATARANWEHMSFDVVLGERALTLPADVEWVTIPVRLECPDGGRRMIGAAHQVVLYLPPVTEERAYELVFRYHEDVNDGWATYRKGTESRSVLRLRPRD